MSTSRESSSHDGVNQDESRKTADMFTSMSDDSAIRRGRRARSQSFHEDTILSHGSLFASDTSGSPSTNENETPRRGRRRSTSFNESSSLNYGGVKSSKEKKKAMANLAKSRRNEMNRKILSEPLSLSSPVKSAHSKSTNSPSLVSTSIDELNLSYEAETNEGLEGEGEGDHVVEKNSPGQSDAPVELVKLLLLGDSGVGKTSILFNCTDGEFQESILSTAGVDFKDKYFRFGKRRIKCQIWDTAGQERFRVIVQAFYSGADGILLVYDVSDRHSFENARVWMDQIKQHSSSDCTISLVANKMDLAKDRHVVSSQEGRDFAKEHELMFFEVSAKTGKNILPSIKKTVQAIVMRNSTPMRPSKVNSMQNREESGGSPKELKRRKCIVS